MINLCYIQARGGSKRFPRKALADWNGHPLVGDAVMKAKATMLFNMVAVSSDDNEILSVAQKYGAIPIWRTPEAASDTATDDDVAREVLGYFRDIDVVCKLYPCVPLLDQYNIVDTWYKLEQYVCDGVYGVDETGKDAGALYMFKYSAWQDKKTINIKDGRFNWYKYRLPKCQDINYPGDLDIARMKAGE